MEYISGKIRDAELQSSGFRDAADKEMRVAHTNLLAQLNNPNPLLTGLQARIPIYKKDVSNMTAKDHEREAKRLRKTEQERKRLKRENKRAAAELKRRRAVAYAALERLAGGSGEAAVAAASKMLDGPLY